MERDTLNELLEWGEKHGIVVPNALKFVYDPVKGFCCVAEEVVEDVKFKIPSDMIITNELAAKYFDTKDNVKTWLKFLVAKMRFGSEAMMVGDEDLREKFSPYINALPGVIDSPIIWNPSELELLESTNLGFSVREKLYGIFKEWKSVIEVDKEASASLLKQFELLDKFDELSDEEIYKEITSQVDGNASLPWYSFPAFLWSHLIFISRAFPEYVIDPVDENNQVILLPIMDLLNHDYHSKVEWFGENRSFYFRKLEPTVKGHEIFNNYGGKGNEELLGGYGFVLENNVFDSVALKIKLPLPIVSEILEHEIALPTISEYTTFAFEVKKEEPLRNTSDVSQYQNGVLYFINKANNITLDRLIDLFSYLNKTENEDIRSLRPRLQGLQNLRIALKRKLEGITDANIRSGSKYPMKEYRIRCAELYRSGQKEILKHSINELKRFEKNWTSENKGNLLTIKRVLKHETQFVEVQLPSLFEDWENVVFQTMNHVLILWVVFRCVKGANGYDSYDWIQDRYQSFIEKSQNQTSTVIEAQGVYDALFPNGSANISLYDLELAIAFIENNSYTRLSTDEIILVK